MSGASWRKRFEEERDRVGDTSAIVRWVVANESPSVTDVFTRCASGEGSPDGLSWWEEVFDNWGDEGVLAPPFNLWTADRIYFTSIYDGFIQDVMSVPREESGVFMVTLG